MPSQRSRSPTRPMRAGAADRRRRTRGQLPDLAAPSARAVALADFRADIYTESSRDSLAFKWRTVVRMLADWGVDLYPPSVEKVYLLGASLKAGGYRSAPGYLSLYRVTCAREGHAFGPDLAIAIRDAARSCTRGIGAPVRATPLPLDRLHDLAGGRDPWVPSGPCSPRNAVVIGTWWLLREVELSTLRARLVEVCTGIDGQPKIFITLPASKTDQTAHGAARGHRCRCSSLASRVVCPVHSALDQLAFLHRQFPSRWSDGVPDWDLPFFPDLRGRTCEKPAVVGTLVRAAVALEVPLADVGGTTRVSGHSLRVGGAQGLTRLGFPLWSIQLLGRWGSDTVKQYVGGAALAIFTDSPAAIAAGQPLDLDTVLGDATQQLLAGSRAGSSLPARVTAAVTAMAGGLRTELYEALLAELRGEMARLTPPTPTAPPTADSGTSPGPSWVQNTLSHKYHLVRVGPDGGGPVREWAARCGWAFGHFGHFALTMPPTASDDSCTQCLGPACRPAQRRRVQQLQEG